MVLPFILGAAAIGAGVTGIKKGIEAVSDNSTAKQLQENARANYEVTKRDLKYFHQNAQESLEKLGWLQLDVWHKQIGRFAELYEQIKNVELTGQVNVGEFNAARFTSEELRQMKDLSLKAQEVMAGGAGALGSGTLVGMATYGGAMMFASASTGTAISSLAGAAATNATLAWFGGGSLAAGGFGMAGGMVVLGGIVTAPVLAVGGMAMAAKAQQNLADAKKYQAEAQQAIEAMNNAIAILEAINDVALKFDWVIENLSQRMTPVLDTLESMLAVSGTNYYLYQKSQQQQVYVAVQFAQLLKLILETPLLTNEGGINNDCFQALAQGQKVLCAQS